VCKNALYINKKIDTNLSLGELGENLSLAESLIKRENLSLAESLIKRKNLSLN
jgi:hypothetical protein